MNAAYPPDFLWGAATSAYQIEGAVDVDGRGESIWDRFSHTPGKTAHDQTGDIACDHYRRWREDIALMSQLGLRAYRFSVAWPRIVPLGRGPVNTPGLDFYDRLVDGLLASGITPFATLYHWDLPQALQDQGGWTAPTTVDAFADYAEVVVRRLGDRVTNWITHNEPWVVSMVGNYFGQHAPGVSDLATALRVAHHLLVSHGRAVTRIRSLWPSAQVGIALNLTPSLPASEQDRDRAAADLYDQFANRWFLDPIFGRGYPSDMCRHYGDCFTAPPASELDEIAVPCDFLGVNYYSPTVVRADQSGGYEPLGALELIERGYELTEMGWPVSPDGLHQVLTMLHHTYRPAAIYITENGAAVHDHVCDGRIVDRERLAYLSGHEAAVRRSIAEGVPVRGYFVWSLMDNFEWAEGYSKRFGLAHVDFGTQTRTLKESARWYSCLIRDGA
jgi:beta-glucosidase